MVRVLLTGMTHNLSPSVSSIELMNGVGGSGFIAAHIVDILLQHGYVIAVLHSIPMT